MAELAEGKRIEPLNRLLSALWQDRQDLLILLAYTGFIGVLFLIVPLAAQALVNIIAAGILVQPLIVLTLAVLIGLIFAGILRALQLMLVELLQQRVFVRIALRLSNHILQVRQSSLANQYAPELINRFFDTLTIQKTLAKILLDGPAVLLQILIGLALLTIYSPYFLLFNLFLLLSMTGLLFLGIGGLRSSLTESSRKYDVAHWLEELGRSETSFKMNGLPRYLMDRTDGLVRAYLSARRQHFRIILRQAFGNYMLQAVCLSGVLAIGGWLVINRQLTLGQLVAAELIVVTVLSALDKLVQQLEIFYDMLTGFDKVGSITDLPVERSGGRSLPPSDEGASVDCESVYFEYEDNRPIFKDLSMAVAPGARISIVGPSGVGKSTLAALICGLYEPGGGQIKINGVDVRDLNLNELRKNIAFVSGSREIFAGTVEENITLGRESVTQSDLQWAIEITEMTRDINLYRHGLQHHVVSEGRNLSLGQRHRLLIARAIAERPQLLIMDESFTGMDEMTKLKIVGKFFAKDNRWTILNISHDAEIVSRTETVHLLGEGRVIETGEPRKLARQSKSAFAELFPELAKMVSGKFNQDS